MIKWTDEMDATLHKLIKEKLAREEIAKVLGVSKNAVIGRAWRLELKFQAQKKKHVQQSPPGPGKTVYVRGRRMAQKRKPKHQRTPTEVQGYLHLDLLTIRDDQCRFIEGQISNGYCGRWTVGEKPYCPQHAAMMYQRRETTHGHAKKSSGGAGSAGDSDQSQHDAV